MASSRPIEPVMHCRKDRPNEVLKLAIRLLNGLYKHPAKFPNPTIDKVFFEAEKEELFKFISTSKGNELKTSFRNNKAKEMHGYCKELLVFVKPICKNDITLIELSGFDPSRQPNKHQPPRQPRILKVVTAGGENLYKIILAKMKTGEGVDPDPATHQRDVKYTVELSLTPDDEKSWNKICISAPSNRLIFDEVFPGQRNYVRVTGINASGRGPHSEISYFTPALP